MHSIRTVALIPVTWRPIEETRLFFVIFDIRYIFAILRSYPKDHFNVAAREKKKSINLYINHLENALPIS